MRAKRTTKTMRMPPNTCRAGRCSRVCGPVWVANLHEAEDEQHEDEPEAPEAVEEEPEAEVEPEVVEEVPEPVLVAGAARAVDEAQELVPQLDHQALLVGALESLGQAHHRPFSRA